MNLKEILRQVIAPTIYFCSSSHSKLHNIEEEFLDEILDEMCALANIMTLAES